MKWGLKNNWKYSKFEKILVLKVYYEDFFFNKNYFLSVDLHNTSYKGGGEVWASKYTHPHYMSHREREKGSMQTYSPHTWTRKKTQIHCLDVSKAWYLQLVLNTQDKQAYGNYIKH